MSVVEISVGKSKYKIECEPSQKEELTRLAEKLNKKVTSISASLRNVDEKTMLVIASLMIESELEDKKFEDKMREDIAAAEKKKEAQPKVSEDDIFNALSDNMENITKQIDKLANKISDY